MLISYFIAPLLGILAGTITGILPGIHINLVSAFLLLILPSLNLSQPLIPALFIVSMSIAHTFIDFIPSIYLGAPNEDTILSILPGHRLLKEGHGHEAVVLTLYGCLAALPIILIFVPIFIFALPFVYNSTKIIMPFLLIFISLFIIFREENFLLSLIIFTLAGFLGFAVLNLPAKQPLLPLLTGLFGLSSLIISVNSSTKIPNQKIQKLKEITLPKIQIVKSSLSAILSAPLCSFLPGIGSAHAATISSEIIPQNNKSFLFTLGSIATIVTALNFVALYAIGKSRSGTSAAIKEILNPFTKTDLLMIIATIIFSAIIAFFIALTISKFFARQLNKINYKTISIFTLFFLIAINFAFSGFLGILILIASTSLGIFANLSNSRRINLMGCLLIPTILFYLTAH